MITKNLIALVVVFALFSVSAFSQKNLPEIVKKEFTRKYATAQSVKWESEEQNEWEAEFTLNGKNMSASFDNSGKWMESETAITEKDLPAIVVNALNKDYQGYKKGEISIYEDSKNKGFELTMKNGESSIEVLIDNAGKIIKKTDKKENENVIMEKK
jgi:Putative beta-lactamase-inhibitor-like, PepSY-like